MIAIVTPPKRMTPQDLYDAAYNWILLNGPRLIFGIVIFFAGLWVIRFLKKRIRGQMSKKQVHSSLQPFFLSLAISALYVALVVLVFAIIGIQLTFFTAIIGAASVAAGLALSGTLQNFAGGVLILLLKPFTLDDNIIAQGVDGYVTAIEVFYTEVLTHDNKAVIIPNGKLFNEIIINVTREGKQRLDLELKFSYAVDTDQVMGIIAGAVKKTPEILTDHEPKIGLILLEADGFRVSVRVWVPTNRFTPIKFTLHDNIVKDIKAAGIKLPGM
ncbi:mechanosensitive ion channel family protein [Mucilaginibacter sp. AW1-3]